MNTPPPTWQPHYTLTPAIARGLMAIEAARAVAGTYRQFIGKYSFGNDPARATMTTHAFTDNQLDRESLTHA